MAQRIMQYQAAIQLSQGAPQIYDLPQLHRQMLEVLGIKNADKLVPTEDDQTPKDPVSENMAFMKGKPTKAFIEQDHDAHIAVHSSLMQDPVIMGQIGQTPMGQGMQAAMMAHIAEHLAFQYRAKLQDQVGAQLPPPDAKLDPVIEAQLSAVVAQAAVQLLQQHQKMAAQKQVQQMQQDPLMQMKQAELQIKQMEAQTKAQKAQTDAQLKQQNQIAQQQIAEQRLQIEAQKVGVMGRSQDPAILQEDRANALRLQQETAMWDLQNQAGEAQQQMNIEQQRHVMQMQHEEQRQQQKMMHEQQRLDLEARMNAAKADNKPAGS
jgi:hypothetical protein